MHLGIDIGGTSVKLGICDGSGRVHARGTVVFDGGATAAEMLERVALEAQALGMGAGRYATCGVGSPGELDAGRRALRRANHLPNWIDVAIPAVLGARLGIPVVLENDANCAAWGESRCGAARGARSVVLFTLGTGVGGGIVLGDDLWVGAAGAAAALGHIVVDPCGPRCRCGQRGCLETFASATAVASRFGRGSAREAFAAAERGEPDGIAAADAAGGALAAAVAEVLHVLQPEVVVLGGGMAAAGQPLLTRVVAGVEPRVRAAWRAHTRITTAQLGADAGWIGAALWGARVAEGHDLRAPEAHHTTS